MEKLNAGELEIVHKIGDLPAPLRSALDDTPMADAGEPFSVGCVVRAVDPLPFARLIFAAVGDQVAYVHYEQGGFAHLYFLACYLLRGEDGKALKTARLIFRAGVNQACSDIEAINRAISAGEISAGEN
ncbi:MAG: hypothetical protein KGS72_05470 [Cyanobacteria bacterium REEB67]|nr:hypothetical protein [Cyanobacteria bacterium REEB67]